MEVWKERRSMGPTRAGKVPRDDWQRDRARIIHSAAFRRLQSKTQVLGLGESDFYRTRLTHSLEVSQIGSGIVSFLRHLLPQTHEAYSWLPEQNLIEAICLAHDLGHPPFGHGGEVALNYCMRNHGGFEGNGQTLRILTTLGEYVQDFGLDLTRRTLLGVLKYPTLFQDAHGYSPENLVGVNDLHHVALDQWHPPKCLFAEEEEVLKWILAPFSEKDQKEFRSFRPQEISLNVKKVNHKRTQYKALDTTIMELADDIAYGVHDLEDAIVLRLVDKQLWEDEVANPIRENPQSELKQIIDTISDQLFAYRSAPRKNAIGTLVHHFVESVEVFENQNLDHPLLKYRAQFTFAAQQELELLKKFVSRHVIHKPEVQMLGYRGQLMILKLFDVISFQPERLLPRNIYDKFVKSPHPERTLTDFISGMTDSYATRFYQRLFTPKEGSIFDRL